MALTVPERLADVRRRVARAAEAAGREPSSVDVVAVSKGQPLDRIVAAYRHGHRTFGESRAQELQVKAAELPDDIVWHFVGPLQRNKVRVVQPLVRLLHSLDRDKLATAWGAGPPALIQVRLGGEPTKHGYEPSEVAAALAHAAAAGVMVAGLMTIPPPASKPADARPWFAQLRSLAESLSAEHELTHLSMGMSDDFEDAIAEGATMVRVGSAIFGPRTEQ